MHIKILSVICLISLHSCRTDTKINNSESVGETNSLSGKQSYEETSEEKKKDISNLDALLTEIELAPNGSEKLAMFNQMKESGYGLGLLSDDEVALVLLGRLDSENLIEGRARKGAGLLIQTQAAVTYDLGIENVIMVRAELQQYHEKFPLWNNFKILEVLQRCRKYLAGKD